VHLFPIKVGVQVFSISFFIILFYYESVRSWDADRQRLANRGSCFWRAFETWRSRTIFRMYSSLSRDWSFRWYPAGEGQKKSSKFGTMHSQGGSFWMCKHLCKKRLKRGNLPMYILQRQLYKRLLLTLENDELPCFRYFLRKCLNIYNWKFKFSS